MWVISCILEFRDNKSAVMSPGWALYFCYVRMRCSSIDMLTYEVSLLSINSNDNLDKSEFLLFLPRCLHLGQVFWSDYSIALW